MSRADYASYVARLKADGVQLVGFDCPACAEKIEMQSPPPGQTWDSAYRCPHCDVLNCYVATCTSVVTTRPRVGFGSVEEASQAQRARKAIQAARDCAPVAEPVAALAHQPAPEGRYTVGTVVDGTGHCILLDGQECGAQWSARDAEAIVRALNAELSPEPRHG